MPQLMRLAGSLAGTLLAYGLYKVIRLIYGELTSPLRDLPGPKSSSWIYGNFKEIWEAVSTKTGSPGRIQSQLWSLGELCPP